MTELLAPAAAIAALRRMVETRWAEAVCADLAGEPKEFSIPLRPGINTGKAVERLGLSPWHDWQMAWREAITQLPANVTVDRKSVTIVRVPTQCPSTLKTDLNGARALMADHLWGVEPLTVDLDRARQLAARLGAAGGRLSPRNLRAGYRLGDNDFEVLISAISWLAEHPDASRWTLRQLPIPGMHSKWLDTHGTLLRDVTGRDVRTEVLPRLTVMHLTYVDPGYLARGGRRHDAWTTDDVHHLAYQPRFVLVVENRDSRLWFPPVKDAVVVEGAGKAAAALLAQVWWLRAAERVFYWGDVDADGFAILDQFRAALAAPAFDGTPGKPVTSILMDHIALQRYAAFGVSQDKAGRDISPAKKVLAHLTAAETEAYHTVATAGATPFRRIEQELIPLDEAARILRQYLEHADLAAKRPGTQDRADGI
ncbi:MAG: Wadjet anti-phage system protein JetD domain-containing protein [Angustibacter sp.]